MQFKKSRSSVVFASLLLSLITTATFAHAKTNTTTSLGSSSNPSVYEQSVTLTATVTPVSGHGTPTGTVTFTQGSNQITKNLVNGVATTGLPNFNVGSYNITATYNGDTNYNTSTSTPLDQVIDQATPVITWPTPAAITAQAALSSTQLDASANWDGSTVNGTYAYTPAAGTYLAAGSDTLKVTFTPTGSGSSNFTTAQGSVLINVYPTNTIIVATNGNDTWSGYLSEPNAPTNPTDGPVASPAKAQALVRAITGTARNSPITVYIRQGNYYLPLSPTAPGTLVFNSQYDSGTSTAGVTWANYPGDSSPVISGGEPANSDPNTWPSATLNLSWNTKGGTGGLGTQYYATLPANFTNFETLYYNGQRRFRARIKDPGAQTNYPSIGYYMKSGVTGQCLATASTPPNQPAPTLASCNLGTYLRVVGTVAYNGTGTGATCTLANSVADSNGDTKCLDRFVFAPTTTGGDAITNWANLNNQYSGTPSSPCTPISGNNYPTGDVELTLIDAWTVDVMRINCIESDKNGNIIYLTGPTNGNTNNYNLMGPTIGHRYVIENALDAFNTAASTTGQTGIWFLDRSSGPTGQWTINYIANTGENPKTDLIVIPQLGAAIPGQPATDYIGASLIYAPSSSTPLSYVTFQGINFSADNFYPSSTGFNNDVNGEYSLPQAIDCESCQYVTFNGVTVGQTSASGISIASPGSTGPQALNNVIEYSVFYDIGDSGVRVGHTPSNQSPYDVAGDVVTGTSVHDNLIKGYSRVFPDGEGIAEGNGNSSSFVNNTITDGYHAGISVCFNTCNPPDSSNNNVNGNNITSQYNLISNLMQGITSDGGSLYYNIGGPNSSGTGGVMESNVIYDVSDSYIIDNGTTAKTISGQVVAGSAYGGEGIYLDAQTANVQVSDNVVYNVDGNAIHLTEGVSWKAKNFTTNELPNAFTNNIFAFADLGMLMQQSPWVQGCPTTLNVTEVTLNENIFNFSKPNNNNAGFEVVQGCTNACGETYSTYQTFTKNAYYNTNTSSPFGSDSNAFQVLEAQGSAGLNPANKNACYVAPYFPLYFGGTACSWQEGTSGTTCTDSNNKQKTLAVTMEEDVNGEIYNSKFPATGLATDPPTYYSFSKNNLTGPPNFSTAGTDDAITNAGRCTKTEGCPADPAPNGVLASFPIYSYTTFY